MTVLLLVLGLLLLLGGAEFLVKGAAALATRIGVSPFLIGLTLVGFGTSSPDLVASLEGAFQGYPGIAVGNVVGSNIANILLILGAAGLVFPMVCDRGALKRDGTMMLLAALALVCDALWQNGWRKSALAPLLGSVLVFGWFYPIISGAPLVGPDSFAVWTWLESWR